MPLKRLPTSRNWCSAFPPGRWTPCRKLEPTDQRGEAFWVRPVPGRTSEITVTSTTVPQMWLMLPDTLWHWRELRSSLQLMGACGFGCMGAGILAAVLLQAPA